MSKNILMAGVLVSTLVLLAMAAPQLEPARPSGPQNGEHKLFRLVETDGELQVFVEPGSKDKAEKYYKDIRKDHLKNFPKELADSDMGDMLAYFGYRSLLPVDLQRLDSAILMSFEDLRKNVSNIPEFEESFGKHPIGAEEIVATRFFAPKIIDVSGKEKPLKYGWRKVIRFKAREKSLARAQKLDAFYLLFNFNSVEPAFPTGQPAGQIQAMLVPLYQTPPSHRDAYFLVYNKLDNSPESGRVGYSLKASFDFATGGPGVKDEYFVPNACGQCHGSREEDEDQKRAKVNYLDTDHWFDRVQQGDDFPQVPKNNVLVDGPANFPAIRTLNQEILAQNKQVDPYGFARLAVEKWLALHEQSAKHVPPLDRALAKAGETKVWKSSNATDAELLPLLNRNCFRCHSSIAYHVFEKKEVYKRKGGPAGILLRMGCTEENPGTLLMPQDRKLDPQTKAKMCELINKME